MLDRDAKFGFFWDLANAGGVVQVRTGKGATEYCEHYQYNKITIYVLLDDCICINPNTVDVDNGSKVLTCTG